MTSLEPNLLIKRLLFLVYMHSVSFSCSLRHIYILAVQSENSLPPHHENKRGESQLIHTPVVDKATDSLKKLSMAALHSQASLGSAFPPSRGHEFPPAKDNFLTLLRCEHSKAFHAFRRDKLNFFIDLWPFF